jgi:hypothetical protein
MTVADWGERNEPSITVVLRMVMTAPFHAEDTMLADCGLHALARRIDRGAAAVCRWPSEYTHV